jgi:hypothetical protein
MLAIDSADSIMKILGPDSERLQDLLSEFGILAKQKKLKIICCFEQHMTAYKKYGVTYRTMVLMPNNFYKSTSLTAFRVRLFLSYSRYQNIEYSLSQQPHTSRPTKIY